MLAKGPCVQAYQAEVCLRSPTESLSCSPWAARRVLLHRQAFSIVPCINMLYLLPQLCKTGYRCMQAMKRSNCAASAHSKCSKHYLHNSGKCVICRFPTPLSSLHNCCAQRLHAHCHCSHMCCRTDDPRPTARKVAIAYPNVPTNSDGTIELFQPFAAAMPAAVVGPAKQHVCTV